MVASADDSDLDALLLADVFEVRPCRLSNKVAFVNQLIRRKGKPAGKAFNRRGRLQMQSRRRGSGKGRNADSVPAGSDWRRGEAATPAARRARDRAARHSFRAAAGDLVARFNQIERI